MVAPTNAGSEDGIPQPGPSNDTPTGFLVFLKSQLSHPPFSVEGPVHVSSSDATRFRNIVLSLSQFLVSDLNAWDTDSLNVASEALEFIDRTIHKIPVIFKCVDSEAALHNVLLTRLLLFSVSVSYGEIPSANASSATRLVLEQRALDVAAHVLRALPHNLSASDKDQRFGWEAMNACLETCTRTIKDVFHRNGSIAYPIQMSLFVATDPLGNVLEEGGAPSEDHIINIEREEQLNALALGLLYVLTASVLPATGSYGLIARHEASLLELICTAWDRLLFNNPSKGKSMLHKQSAVLAKLLRMSGHALSARSTTTTLPRNSAVILARLERWTKRRLEEGPLSEYEDSDQQLASLWNSTTQYCVSHPSFAVDCAARGDWANVDTGNGLREVMFAYLRRSLPYLPAKTLSHLHQVLPPAGLSPSLDALLAALHLSLRVVSAGVGASIKVIGKRKRVEEDPREGEARQLSLELLNSSDILPSLPISLDETFANLIAPLPSCDRSTRSKLAESLSKLPCLLSHPTSSACLSSDGDLLAEPQIARFLPRYLHTMARILDAPATDIPFSLRSRLLDGLQKAVKHFGKHLVDEVDTDLASVATRAMERDERSVRLSAGRVIVEMFKAYRVIGRDAMPRANGILSALIVLVEGRTKPPVKETTLVSLGAIGRTSDSEIVSRVLACLLAQLGHENSLIKALAYTQLQSLAKSQSKSPYSLISPYLPQISIFLVEKLVSAPQILFETCQLVSLSRHDFLSLTLTHTLPALVAGCRRDVLDIISKELEKNLAAMCLQAAHDVLAYLFLCKTEMETDSGISFLLAIVGEAAGKGAVTSSLSVANLIKSCMVPLLAELVIVLGHEDQTRVQLGIEALKKVERRVTPPPKGQRRPQHLDLPAFLKAHMLGIISHLNDVLQDVQGKKTAAMKKQVIRSLGTLIELVGPSVSSVSPQIMATLHNMLGIDALREVALVSWRTFVTTLPVNDVGPYVGQTSAAFVTEWPRLSVVERQLAKQTIDYLVHHGDQFNSHLSEIVSLKDIPELSETSERLAALRAEWTVNTRLGQLLDRATSENSIVTLRALEELKSFMLANRGLFQDLASGDSFDAAVGQTVKVLFAAACRDGDAHEPLRLLAYECLGILGAVDPDRLELSTEDAAMIVLHNFGDENENATFVLHLIRDLLVGAFRSTSDIKYQSHLAFAIQELLKICGFGPELVVPGASTSVPMKVRNRWNSLPKHVLETISPLLEGRFTLNNKALPDIHHPIYSSAPTYREWLQVWTAYLITRVTAPQAKRIFEVFRSAVRNQDVGVAHHLLPHIVLNVLVTGDEDDCDKIRIEIISILEDQVNPRVGVAADRRMLSAQTIFSLMDHLSKWIRLSRQETNRRRTESARYRQGGNVTNIGAKAEERLIRVDSMLSSIDQELMARAALHCKYFARSLLSFEQRVVSLHESGLSDVNLQPYYESLHQIYAQLDEPDGMAGVSTRVISPSLEHQIREHETIGRWTSAQSCWEVKLQGSPDNVDFHQGLLRCLRNLGHYDTLRTHVKGVLSRKPEWMDVLSSYQVEGAWMVGDWTDVEELTTAAATTSAELYIARLLLAIRNGDNAAISATVRVARKRLGDNIMAAGKHSYRGSYDAVVGLHLLHELEMMCTEMAAPMDRGLAVDHGESNGGVDLNGCLARRFDAALPTFRAREPILSMRRTAYNLKQAHHPAFRVEIGKSWLTTARIARKAGYAQTAYSATLQARKCDAPFAFLQTCKLLRSGGEPIRALQELENALASLTSNAIDLTGEVPVDLTADTRTQAKALALQARWMNEADRFETDEIVAKFFEAIKKGPRLESPYYHLGHYYDEKYSRLSAHDKLQHTGSTFNFYTCKYYAKALSYGSKYIYQAMPRILTIWLDMGDTSDSANAVRAGEQTQQNLHSARNRITDTIDKASRRLPAWQWLTAFPQIVSRIGHSNATIFAVLVKVMSIVLREYPQQALWLLTSASKSKKPERARRCDQLFNSVRAIPSSGRTHLTDMIAESVIMTTELLNLSDYVVPNDQWTLSMTRNFRELNKLAPSRLILPLQDSMTVTLPPISTNQDVHQPFHSKLPVITEFLDEIEIMKSLQKPRKISIKADDGKTYSFLCKPKDDLRKDARLMDFNSMINKLLKTNSDSRRRQLHIRTYGVIPLNEECGCLEWVPHTVGLRNILLKAYEARNIKCYTPEMGTTLENARGQGTSGKVFEKQILPRFPPVFHEWFLSTFPEPAAWLSSRLAYARTAAVMSMVGYILGLGDRHGENILFDYLSGDTVHVDFNCLFEKGKTFEIPERVPFRLTHNMVDGLGVTGVEGVFRIACEITMDILRSNKDSLMSVLEAFVHDPLSEWEEEKKRRERDARFRQGQARARRSAAPSVDDGKVPQLKELAQQSLEPIERKLRGVHNTKDAGQREINPSNQVEALIREATSPSNLGLMYVGWAAWM